MNHNYTSFEPQNDLCSTTFGQYQANLRMARKIFNFNYTNHNSTKNWRNKPSRGVSRLPTVFLAKKLSKYRLKPPKYILRRETKKLIFFEKKMQKTFILTILQFCYVTGDSRWVIRKKSGFFDQNYSFPIKKIKKYFFQSCVSG